MYFDHHILHVEEVVLYRSSSVKSALILGNHLMQCQSGGEQLGWLQFLCKTVRILIGPPMG